MKEENPEERDSGEDLFHPVNKREEGVVSTTTIK